MKNSKREEIVSHSAKKLFNIVLDIQSYPEYIPWCTKMVVNEKKSDEIFADMYVKYKFILTQKFGSHVKFNKKELTIQTSYLEGPLKDLKTNWKFEEVKKNISISTAESCTGGLLASSITKIKDTSKIYLGGYITYSNELKIRDLGVKKTTIKKYGAVSKETALEMVNGLFIKNKTDVCISTTGIAGPGGGTKSKPVGLIYIGILLKGKKKIFKKKFSGSRLNIQKDCVSFIFNYLNKSI